MTGPAKRRALVLVTEGVSPELVSRWGPELLPHFHLLINKGASGVLSADQVPYEPPGLISAFSGYAPGCHGWYSYWTVHDYDHQPQVLTSSMARRVPLWHRPELAKYRFAVINIFGTHPPQSMNGFTVTYPTSNTTHACYPAQLHYTLSRSGVRLINDVSVWFSGQPRKAFLGPVLAADRARADLALCLLDKVDVVVVNFTAIDRLSHVYWQEIEPSSPVPLEDAAVFHAYRACDEVLGQLLDRVDDRTSLLAFSEIGFGPLRAYCSLNEVLREAGFLKEDAATRRPNWSATRAFESVQGTNGINVNLRGRYADAVISPADYQAVRADVAALLREHVNPLTGLPMFTDIMFREDVYAGSAVVDAVDLITVPADERYLPYGDPYWSDHLRRSLQSGWHRRSSYWAGVGSAFVARRQERVAQPIDVASTVFAMLDLPIPNDLQGVPLGASG